MRLASLLPDTHCYSIPVFSNGWLASFTKRHNLKSFKSYGESGGTHTNGIDKRLRILQSELAKNELCNICNLDETGLF